MKKLSFILLSLLTLGIASPAYSQTVEATINPDKVITRIDEKTYGHFLEHIYNSCNGGLWGELVWNRSFEAGNDSAKWTVNNGAFVQQNGGSDIRLLLGDESWSDYELTLKAKKLIGQEGFLILFRATENSTYYWANLGGWRNESSAVEKSDASNDSRFRITPQVNFKVETGRDYQITVRAEGKHFTIAVDGKTILDFTDDKAPATGSIGLGTWNTMAEYSDIIVKDLTGKVLFDGKTVTDLNNSIRPSKNIKVRYWTVTGSTALVSGDARNSDKFVRFFDAGNLFQENKSFEKGETYDYSYWTRGNGSVEFKGNQEKVNCDKWTKVCGTFTVDQSTQSGSIQLNVVPQSGKTVDIDQFSIMPRSWKEKYAGMRPDLLNAIKEIHPAVIRWPGGCYASAYRWKDGIGAQDDRGSYPFEMWNDKDVNSFGIDEFVEMCRRVGAEPIMVVDLGTKQWTDRVFGADTVDWLQEAVDWVEYCNGPATSKWGAVRAKNGHEQPYNIKYFEMDNEVHPNSTPSDTYVQMINQVVPRMKAVDPSIKIIACGSWTGHRIAWNTAVVNGAGKNIDYLSTHQYDNPNGYAVNPYNNQRFFEQHREIIANSPNPNIRMFDSEWNAQSTDWRTGLHAGGILNCFERVNDVLDIAAPALFLRHTSATGWDNAFVNFDHTGWFPAPNYVVMKLWQENYLPRLVELTSSAAELSGDNPIVNAVATSSDCGKQLVFKAVNNKMEPVTIKLNVASGKIKSVSAVTVTPELKDGEQPKDKLSKRNTLEQKNAIAPKAIDAAVENGYITVVLPCLSANLVKIEME